MSSNSAKTTQLLTGAGARPGAAAAPGGRGPAAKSPDISRLPPLAAMQSARVRVTDLPTNAADIAGPEQHEQRTPLRFGAMRFREHSAFNWRLRRQDFFRQIF